MHTTFDFSSLMRRLTALQHSPRWSAILIGLFLLLFAVNESYRFVLAVLALIGLVLWIRNRQQAWSSGFKWYLALFLCLWIPMLISTVDAESLRSTLSVSLRYLIYLLAGYFIIERLPLRSQADTILAVVLAILLFWMADGILQLITGENLFGRKSFEGNRLTGMLPGVKLGIVLAIFSPVFFYGLHRFNRVIPGLWLMLIPYFIVILYGGSRVSWMLLALAVVLYWLALGAQTLWFDRRRVLILLSLIMVVSLSSLLQSDWLRDRVTQLSGLLSNDYTAFNVAVSDRLPHWLGAARMFEQNQINGIGANGFADAYSHYSGGDPIHRSQPHLFVLEVAAETGIIGLSGYTIFCVLLLTLMWRLKRQGQYAVLPWALTLFLAAFPLSASLSLYAHFMSALIWYLAMVVCTLLVERQG